MASPSPTLRLSTAYRTLRRIPSSFRIATTHRSPISQQFAPSSTNTATRSLPVLTPYTSSQNSIRCLHTTTPSHRRVTKGHNNEPVPSQPPPTDFEKMDVLGQTPVPSTSVDICYSDGFKFNSGTRIMDGNGALLVGGEAFVWRPWEARKTQGSNAKRGEFLVNEKGQWEVGDEAWGLLGLVWPRPGMIFFFSPPPVLFPLLHSRCLCH